MDKRGWIRKNKKLLFHFENVSDLTSVTRVVNSTVRTTTTVKRQLPTVMLCLTDKDVININVIYFETKGLSSFSRHFFHDVLRKTSRDIEVCYINVFESKFQNSSQLHFENDLKETCWFGHQLIIEVAFSVSICVYLASSLDVHAMVTTDVVNKRKEEKESQELLFCWTTLS